MVVDKKYISPYKFINSLFDVASSKAIFIPDAGMNITSVSTSAETKKSWALKMTDRKFDFLYQNRF